MQTESQGVPANASTVVGRRFWTLIILVLGLAIGTSAIAVKLTAGPFLEAQAKDALEEKVFKDAFNFSQLLERDRRYLAQVSDRDEVISLVVGYSSNLAQVLGYLEGPHDHERLDWIGVFDIAGDQLAENDIRANGRPSFDSHTLRTLAVAIADEVPGAADAVGYQPGASHGRLLLAVPVYNRGLVEGSIIAQFSFELTAVFPPSDIADAVLLVPSEQVNHLSEDFLRKAVVAPIATTDLTLLLVPDYQAASAAGMDLLARTVGAVSGVLTLSIAIFAWIGRAALVEPHRRLELQKQKLAELAAVVERANEAIVIMDLDGRVLWVNPAHQQLSGFTLEEVRGQRAGSYLEGPKTSSVAVKKLWLALQTQSPALVELQCYNKSGAPYWLSVSLSPLLNEDGSCYGFTAVSQDVTERRQQQDALLAAHAEIEQQALQDPLTRLPNRRALDLALESRSKMPDPSATVVRIDLDLFKHVNDTLGHAAGDFVLQDVARILRERTKSVDLPARVGGDEFVLLLGPGSTPAEAGVLAERVKADIEKPKTFAGRQIRVSACFGVASTASQLVSLDEVIIAADAALYEAKEMGRAGVRHYTPTLHRAVLDHRSLARELRNGIAGEEFEPWFQPQFDARTRVLVGLETLARWNSPSLGLLAPGNFLPVAAQMSMVNDIDQIIFRKAIEQIHELAVQGVMVPKVSFNVTAERVQDSTFVDEMRQHVGKGPKIALEILETVLVEEQSDLFGFSLDRLRDLGVSIEIDDFGSGHASIIGLLHLKPEVIKVDKRLVDHIVLSETSRGILRQIIGMARLMDNRVTAEGVETMEQADLLAGLGVNTLQGFALGPPMPMDQLKHFTMPVPRPFSGKRAVGGGL